MPIASTASRLFFPTLVKLGTRLGFLVVSEQGEERIYRRAVRIIRTMHRAFGDIGVVPIEAECLRVLVARSWNADPSQPPISLTRPAAGGETLEWGRAARDRLRRAGKAAAFVVVEPYIPPILKATWERAAIGELDALANPVTGARYRMRKWSDYYTGSQIDMA